MVFSNNLLMGAAGQGGGYEIDQSIRFNDDDTPILSRTLGTPTDQNKFTYSFWVKPSKEANGYALETNVTSGTTFSGMVMDGGSMQFFDYTSGSAQVDIRTAFINGVKFRDYSAWYHALFVYDSDQGTNSNRLKFYINGVQFPVADIVGPLGGSPVWPSSGYNSKFNSNVVHRISSSANGLVDGYMADIYFIDGQALDPTSFGETNDNGVWIPIEYTGSYGNNGFYITGETASDLGEDFSGNNNDFTSSGLTTADQMSDTPTLNFCTLNPLITPATMTLTDGNLALSGYTAVTSAYGTFGMSSGKWYWEMVAQTNAMAGVAATPNGSQYPGQAADSYAFDLTNGTKYNNGSSSAFGAGSVSAGNTVGVAFDADSGDLKFYNNSGTLIGTAFSGLTSGPYFPVFRNGSAANISINFGQQTFSHSLPTSHVALNTANLPTPSIKDGSAHFNPVLFTGNSGTAFSVTGVGFQPDFVWGKPRSLADNHRLMDVVRGSTNQIISNSSGAEFTQAQGITSFDSDGFTVGTHNGLNNGTNTYVAWNWLADNTTGSSNEDGDITSTVSANTTSGFSILTYTGNGSDNQEIGHGIGIAPKMIITKRRNTSGSNWTTYHDAVGINQVFYLNSTSAPTSNTEQYRAVPTSSVYTIGVGGDINASGGTYVAYVFAEVDGYSSIGGYTGNGSTNGTFVYTGFKPAFVILKRTNATQEWQVYDTQRDSYNVADHKLEPNSSSAESTSTSNNNLDFLSNGFKLRQANGGMNASGSTYIYMAFAEHPFGGGSAAPATAR
jgi:hypothetical protein